MPYGSKFATNVARSAADLIAFSLGCHRQAATFATPVRVFSGWPPMHTEHMLKMLALLAIRFYQRFISPHKGFSCAYRLHTGRSSCSALGYRAIRRWGLAGRAVLQLRFERCRWANQQQPRVLRRFASQRGECDLGCAPDCGGSADLDCCVDERRIPSLIRECCGSSCGGGGGAEPRDKDKDAKRQAQLERQIKEAHRRYGSG